MPAEGERVSDFAGFLAGAEGDCGSSDCLLRQAEQTRILRAVEIILREGETI